MYLCKPSVWRTPSFYCGTVVLRPLGILWMHEMSPLLAFSLVTRTKDWQLSLCSFYADFYAPHMYPIHISYYATAASIKNSCNGTQNTSVYSGTRTTSTKVDVSEKGKNNSPLKMPHYSHSLHLKIHSRFSAWSTFGYTCQTFCIPLQMPNSTLLRVDQSRSCLISRKRSWIANCQIWW